MSTPFGFEADLRMRDLGTPGSTWSEASFEALKAEREDRSMNPVVWSSWFSVAISHVQELLNEHCMTPEDHSSFIDGSIRTEAECSGDCGPENRELPLHLSDMLEGAYKESKCDGGPAAATPFCPWTGS